MLPLKALFLVALLLSVLTLRGQRDFPYSLDLEREVSLFGLGLSATAAGHLLEAEIAPLTPAQLSRKRRGQVWLLDRGATRNECPIARLWSDRLLRSAAVLPAVALVNRQSRRKVLVLGTMIGQTMLLNGGLTKLIKVATLRSRPLTFNEEYDDYAKVSGDARLSFVSGHTSNTAALSFFTAKVLHDLYPDSPWRPVFWATAAAVPLATGYARYRAGKHFPTDIVAGYALGAALGILVPQWHKQQRADGWRLGVTDEGVGVVLRW